MSPPCTGTTHQPPSDPSGPREGGERHPSALKPGSTGDFIPVSVANPPAGPPCRHQCVPVPIGRSQVPRTLTLPGPVTAGEAPRQAMPWDHPGKHHLTLPGRCKTGEAPHESALHWDHPTNPHLTLPGRGKVGAGTPVR